MSRTKDLSMKVGASSKDEIGTLADAFNNMVEEVKTHISNLQRANIELLEVLGSAIAKRDSDTSVHNYRVTVIAIRLAEAAGLGRGEIKALIKGSFLHDVGKIGISDNILIKPDRLTSEEFETMKGHVRHGIDIISSYNWLKDASDVVRYHHEKYDGSGYMSGMSGEDIPLNARIFAIADVFDALTSLRPYKKPLCYEDAMRILEESSGSHFDPNLLGVFKGIAETVYGEIVHAGDSDIEDVLKRLINEYFYRG
ncbi:MAG: HD domain-containing protein [Deltaproteobacteria bacterium]|nr:HD domain-containing protein [Deltaproteobacteria bacterium]